MPDAAVNTGLKGDAGTFDMNVAGPSVHVINLAFLGRRLRVVAWGKEPPRAHTGHKAP